jgi:peptidoglycan/LPS O-acetylase OafA/YrhL
MERTAAPVHATGSSRITQLDGLRGIAIAMVFIYHAFHVPGLWTGVDLFFVLSGFLITGILFNQKERPFGEYIRHFYARRARRILPPYAVVLLITGLLFGFGFLRYWYMFFGLMNFQGTTSMPAGPAYLPLWSLAVEEQFYFVWPLVVYVLDRKRLIGCAIFMLLLAPVLRLIFTPYFGDQGPINQWLPFRMDTLAAGAVLALMWPEIRRKVERSPRLRRRAIVAAGAVVIVSVVSFAVMHVLGYRTTANNADGNTVPYTVALAVMVNLVFLALLGVGKRVLSAWPLVWLGRVSFSFYLIHLTVLHFAPGHSAWIGLVGSLGYSLGMWFLVEKPMTGPGQSRETVLVQGGG